MKTTDRTHGETISSETIPFTDGTLVHFQDGKWGWEFRGNTWIYSSRTDAIEDMQSLNRREEGKGTIKRTRND